MGVVGVEEEFVHGQYAWYWHARDLLEMLRLDDTAIARELKVDWDIKTAVHRVFLFLY